MTALTQKIQVLLTDEQYRALQTLAKTHGKPISVFLRESIVEQLVAEARRAAKQKAFEEIVTMTLPVSDWPEMEDEIERSHIDNQTSQ